MILRQDIYATAAFAGALTYVASQSLGIEPELGLWAGAGVCFVIRASALLWGWSLPKRKALSDDDAGPPEAG
jgi:uncharacterized membrane protein YeiH